MFDLLESSCIPAASSSHRRASQVDSNEDPLECTASVLLLHEVFGALYDRDKRQVGQAKAFLFQPMSPSIYIKIFDSINLH